MIFVIKTYTIDDPGHNDLFPALRRKRYRWSYRQGTKDNPGDTLAVGPDGFDTEKACRSHIAKARKAFGGARMAKVVAGADLTGGSDA